MCAYTFPLKEDEDGGGEMVKDGLVGGGLDEGDEGDEGGG